MEELDTAVLRSDPVLRWYLRLTARAGLSRGSIARDSTLLVMIAAALFSGFGVVTCYENRFFLRSRDLAVAPGSGDVTVGLGFLGDTMVWPFFFLVPLLIILLRRTLAKAAEVCRSSGLLVRRGVLHQARSRTRLEPIVQRAGSHLCYTGAVWRCLWWAAFGSGLLLFAYNATICLRADAWPNAIVSYDMLWPLMKPYAHHEAVIIPANVEVTLKDAVSLVVPSCAPGPLPCLQERAFKTLTIDHDGRHLLWRGPLSREEQDELAAFSPGQAWQQTVQALARLKTDGFDSGIIAPFEKWDTDRLHAPLTWWATRGWVLLCGYALLPLIALRVLNIVFTMWQFARSMAEAGVLRANPYSPGSKAGLEPLIETFLDANSCLLVLSAMVALAFFKVGSKPEWHDLALLVLIPMFAFAAVAPLLSISSAFERHVKQQYLALHVRGLDRMHARFHAQVARMDDATKAACIEALTRYDDYLSRGQQAAILPLSLTTITNLAAPVAPLALALAERAIEKFF